MRHQPEFFNLYKDIGVALLGRDELVERFLLPRLLCMPPDDRALMLGHVKVRLL